MKAIIEVRRDSETGELGYCLASMPVLDDISVGNDILISHDILEHINGAKNIGSVYDECIALGVTWYIRGQFGIFDRQQSYHSPHEILAGDLSRMFQTELYEKTLTSSLDKVRIDNEFQEDFQSIGEHAKKQIISELEYSDEPANMGEIDLYISRSLKAMTLGLRKARRRYKDPYMAHELFFAIADAVKNCASIEYEGQRFAVYYNFQNIQVYCEEFYEFDSFE